ncbi:hypothetical protein M408DRAFT_266357 [Serendipita vermifera MAFF 305830]|uniref:Uncharacterized protein n=1 Tax=Serendipita vermifera MAFF 305830 TaxID=933852 RepID=A0A0C3AV83_SERVB|nr:hypothetical protein M408DRAFT_266357 [Serendipita vermifera MAFF 305830]
MSTVLKYHNQFHLGIRASKSFRTRWQMRSCTLTPSTIAKYGAGADCSIRPHHHQPTLRNQKSNANYRRFLPDRRQHKSQTVLWMHDQAHRVFAEPTEDADCVRDVRACRNRED